LADTPLETLWLPLPMLTPGLTFAEAFTSLLPMPTFAPTPTFGLTFVVEDVAPGEEVEGVLPRDDPDEADDCVPLADWFSVDDEFTSSEFWFAVTPLPTDCPAAVFGVASAIHFGGAALVSPWAFRTLQSGIAPLSSEPLRAAEVCARTGVATPRIATVARLLMK
jgi:hypothetical protein